MAPAITLAAEAPKLSAANTGFMLICSALVLIMTPGLAALLLGLTVAMCAISALSAIGKVMRIDPAVVFNR